MPRIMTAGLVFLGMVLPVFGQNPNLGTVGAQFLKLPVAARALGTGGAYISLVDDGSAIFWNPAGLAGIKSSSLHFSQVLEWINFFEVTSAALAFNLGAPGVVGLGVLSFHMDAMEITTEKQPLGTGRTFDAQDLAVLFSYARNLTDRFRVGISGKYIHQRIWNEVARGFAFDIGTQYRVPFRDLTMAMSMTSFGPDLTLRGPDLDVTHDSDPDFPNRLIPARKTTETYPLPLNFEFGIGFNLIRTSFLNVRALVDAVHPNDNDERLHFGTEVSLGQRLFLRGGYKLNHDDENISLGAGTVLDLARYSLWIDYAWTRHEYLPDVQMLSLGIEY